MWQKKVLNRGDGRVAFILQMFILALWAVADAIRTLNAMLAVTDIRLRYLQARC
jgi:hypothetical protein